MSFAARLAEAVRSRRSWLVVGIDPHPDRLGGDLALTRRFCHALVEASAGRVPAVKPQFAFFEALGVPGMALLAEVIDHARRRELLVIGDAKRGDIGTTAAAYAAAALGPQAPFACDALTVSPFLGPDTLEPFLAAADRCGGGLFVLWRTSNPGSATFQAPVADALAAVIEKAAAARLDATGLGPVGAVVGATTGAALAEARRLMPSVWQLVPGYGAQGGTATDAAAGRRADGLGALVVSARALSFPPASEEAAWKADPAPFFAARLDQALAELGP